MGRPVGRNLEDELMTKIKLLFDRTLDAVNKENPMYTFDFEQFVDCFDVNDHFFKRIFEFLVKETAQRYRTVHPYGTHSLQPRQHTIHHVAVAVAEGNSDSNSSNSSADSNTASSGSSATLNSGQHQHLRHSSQRPSPFARFIPSTRDRLSSRSSTDLPSQNEEASSAGSSGAALRYIMARQGFSQTGSRRSRIAQRMLSNDLFAYQHGQPSLLSTISAASNASSFPEISASESRVSDQHTSETAAGEPGAGAGAGAGTGTGAEAEAGATARDFSSEASTSGTTTAAGLIATPRRSSRRGETLERQRAFLFRPQSRLDDLAASMESAPESFRPETLSAAYAADAFDPSLVLFRDRVDTPEIGHMDPPVPESFRHAQDLRQQQIRQFYIQTMQARGRQRHSSLGQLDATNLHRRETQRILQGGEDSQPQQQQQQESSQQQQQQTRYPLSDNGLMLVHPSSPSLHAPFSNILSDDTAGGLVSRFDSGLQSSYIHRRLEPFSLPSALNSTSDENLFARLLPFGSSRSTYSLDERLEERHREFIDSTQRGRAAMRNALAADLIIEEDPQVLLTGEVSRRRRRRVQGRFSQASTPLDLALENSNAIISQQQHRQHQQHNEQTPIPSASRDQVSSTAQRQEPLVPSIQAPLQSQGSGEATEESAGWSVDLVVPSTTDGEATAVATPLPGAAADPADSNPTDSRSETTEVAMGGNSGNPGNSGDRAEDDSQQHRSVPPTPPSPNPNRNPMPTFADRRRSSINPADIEAVVREMEANAQSGTVGWAASRIARATVGLAARDNSRLSVLATTHESPELDLMEEGEDEQRVELRGDETGTHSRPDAAGQREGQPLPSPPQTEPEADSLPVGAGSPTH
ncbi:hypothetical protein BGZ98_002228 [Dissophora globulifera]|nr:hypothetical protein BGZ98_002228 [Dissophora globulifera]